MLRCATSSAGIPAVPGRRAALWIRAFVQAAFDRAALVPLIVGPVATFGAGSPPFARTAGLDVAPLVPCQLCCSARCSSRCGSRSCSRWRSRARSATGKSGSRGGSAGGGGRRRRCPRARGGGRCSFGSRDAGRDCGREIADHRRSGDLRGAGARLGAPVGHLAPGSRRARGGGEGDLREEPPWARAVGGVVAPRKTGLTVVPAPAA